MTINDQRYYENYWRHRLKHEPGLTRQIPLRIKLALTHLPPWPVTILDLGCGEGSLGRAAKAINPRHCLVGADIAPTALKLARSGYDSVIPVDFDRPHRPAKLRQKFDVVTALEVIEHLRHPGRLLGLAFTSLLPGGKLILSFPNTQWWGFKHDRPAYTTADHNQFFNLNSITQLLNRQGFWIETIDGIFTLPWYFGRLPHPLQKFLGQVRPDLFGYQLILVCRKKNKSTVAHLIKDYLNPSESWLYTQVTTSRQTFPLVLCRNRKNLDQFPYPALGKYPLLTDNLGPSLFRKTAALAQTLKDRWLGPENKYYRRLITASGARLIHAHYGPTGWEAIGLKRQTHLPLVVSFYGGDAYWLPTNFPIWRRRYLNLWRAADVIIVKGPKMKQRLVELGCPQSKIRIIDHGVNLAKIPFRPRRRQPGEPVRLLSACTLVDYKGVSHTVQAVARVRLALPQLRLTIFGSGPQEKQIKKLINGLKLNQIVSLKPFLPWGKLIKACGRYQLFIHPSYTTPDNKQEGVPTSLIERAASGMPVIATRHADIPEIVKNGLNGYLVPENDVQALAEKLITLVNQPERWRQFGQNGRKLVIKSFDAVKQTAVRERLYASLIAGNASRKYVRSGNAAVRR